MEPVEAGKSLGARTAEGGRRKAPACSDRRQETAASFPISQIRVAFDVQLLPNRIRTDPGSWRERARAGQAGMDDK